MLFNREDKIIFVDVDDTIANTRQGVADIYTRITGNRTLTLHQKSKQYKDFCPGWTDEDIEKLFIRGVELYDVTKPIPGAEKAIEALIAKGYDVRIVTMHSPTSMDAKYQWIKKYFPMLEGKVYYVDWRIGNKDVFKGYSLIDDDMKNIKTNKSCKPILLDLYNIYPNVADYIKCRSWDEVLTNL